MGILIGSGIFVIGSISLFFCLLYLQVVVSATTLSLRRWFHREVFDKNEIQSVRFTAEDVVLLTSRGSRKLAQFTRKRKEFVAALRVNATRLATLIEEEFQRGEKL